jgi:hypothetical protein
MASTNINNSSASLLHRFSLRGRSPSRARARGARVAAVAGVVVMLSALVGVAPSVAQAGGTWNGAVEVSGSAALNVAGNGEINAVSCTAPGTCSAIGSYSTSSTVSEAYVVDETKGVWGTAIEVPGFGALNAGGVVGDVLTISCSSAGNCAAGGSYNDTSADLHAFVVNETNGTWGSAIEVPGFAILNTGGLIGSLLTVSCVTNGNCSAGGIYGDTSGNVQAFVVNETNGTWGDAEEVPGSGGLNAGNVAYIGTMSCASAGNCGAGGFYTDASTDGQAFVVNETNGTWGNAIEVPGTSTLNAGGSASVTSISCAAATSCSAVGNYEDSAKVPHGFTINETNGSWGTLTELGGVNSGSTAVVTVACAAVGDCTAGGGYNDVSGNSQAFTVNESGGVWGSTSELPGTSALNLGNNAAVASVFCTVPGDCTVAGYYTDSATNQQAFVANESEGTFANAIEIPGTAALNADGNAFTDSISCSVDGGCSTGGYYEDASQDFQSFVATSSATFTVPSTPRVKVTSPQSGVVTISVLNSSSNGGRSILSYQYSLNGGGWRDSTKGASAHITIAHLKPGVSYRVAVRATNAVGTGSASRADRLTIK